MLLLVLAQADHSWIERGGAAIPDHCGVTALRTCNRSFRAPQQTWPSQGRPEISGVARRSGWPVRGRCAAAPASASAAGLPSSPGGTGGAVPVEKEAAPHSPGRPVTGEQRPCRPRRLAAVYDPYLKSATAGCVGERFDEAVTARSRQGDDGGTKRTSEGQGVRPHLARWHQKKGMIKHVDA
jgi:hypothetical protein